jgi:hypothetical protein
MFGRNARRQIGERFGGLSTTYCLLAALFFRHGQSPSLRKMRALRTMDGRGPRSRSARPIPMPCRAAPLGPKGPPGRRQRRDRVRLGGEVIVPPFFELRKAGRPRLERCCLTQSVTHVTHCDAFSFETPISLYFPTLEGLEGKCVTVRHASHPTLRPQALPGAWGSLAARPSQRGQDGRNSSLVGGPEVVDLGEVQCRFRNLQDGRAPHRNQVVSDRLRPSPIPSALPA